MEAYTVHTIDTISQHYYGTSGLQVDVTVEFSFCYYRGCHLVVTVVYIVSLICTYILEFVFNEYSNLHQIEFKSKVKYRKLYSNAREVLLI